MTIRNMDTYIKNLWDFGFIERELPGKCAVSDLDGVIERNGQFLVIETKSPGAKVPMGQAIMFSALQKLDSFTVVVIYGKPEHVEKMRVWPEQSKMAGNVEFLKFVSEWWNRVDAMPRPSMSLPVSVKKEKRIMTFNRGGNDNG